MKRVLVPITTICFLLLGSGILATSLIAQETRELKPFDGIGIGISADVFYSKGSAHEIKIEGNEKDVKDLITKVDDGYLKLKYDDWKTKRSKLTIYITSSELEKVSLSGSGKFRTDESISSEEMTIAISGSGSILFTSLQCEEVEVKISGSGNVILEKGKAEEMDVRLSGSGKVLAEHFETSEFSAAISGSGGCKITVSEELEARISGSGSVHYHGDPQINSSASGSGKVRSF
jgi:hypothetical protein